MTQAILAHVNTPGKILGLSHAQIAFGRSGKDFFAKSVESLTHFLKNLLSAAVKEQKHRGIRAEAGRRIDFHTKVLKELEVGDCVQLQNLRGKHPLKLDQAGVVTPKNGFSNYLVKLFLVVG